MEKYKKIKLVFGVGNPGVEYVGTRHNFGRDLVGAYADNPKVLSYSAYAKHGKFLLGYSLGFVNDSGKAMAELVKVLKLKPDEILVIHDEADMPLFRLKFSFGKSSAGHKGVESIRRALKTYNFWRLRLGIQGRLGQAPQKVKHQTAMDIVLKKLKHEELAHWQKLKRKKFPELLDRLSEVTPDRLNVPQQFLI